MGDISANCTFREASPNLGVKTIIVTTPTTTDTADTIPITLASYGITTVLAVDGYVHTTENSVIVAEAPTTAVSSGTLTITVGGSVS